MTSYTRYQCDGCNKEFEREDLIAWGIDTHYCMGCAIREIRELADNITTKVRTLDFDNENGRDVLEEVYQHMRVAVISLAQYEGEQ